MAEDDDERPFDPDCKLVTYAGYGLFALAATVVGFHEHEPLAWVAVPIAALLLFGWVPAVRGWVRTEKVLQLQSLCVGLVFLFALGTIIFAVWADHVVTLGRHPQGIRYAPGLCTAVVTSNVSIWGNASGWPKDRITRAARFATWTVGSVEVVVLYFVIRAVINTVSHAANMSM